MAAQGFVSKSDLDTYRANLAVAEATVKSDQAAADLGYVANPAARALASKQSHNIVVLVPSLANQLFIETLEAIHAVMHPRGLEVLIGNYHYSRDEEENLLRNYLAYQPRGLLLTGSLGDVMKESAQTALSYLRAQSKTLGVDMTDYNKYDIHIHVPAGATPKDGPSAGVTLLVALASLLTKRRVRSEYSMTGEISLRGRVMRVGGIKEKVLAAARFGIKHVILPDQNKTDWLEVPEEVRKKLQVHFVKHISELLPLALRPK